MIDARKLKQQIDLLALMENDTLTSIGWGMFYPTPAAGVWKITLLEKAATCSINIRRGDGFMPSSSHNKIGGTQ